MTRYCINIYFLCITYREYIIMSSMAYCSIIWMS